MQKYFSIIILEEADLFLTNLDQKTKEKIIYNIDKASFTMDKELFKKLNSNIWEFRTLYNSKAYRLFSFWDKESECYVVCTHGILKKTQKTPQKEIDRAEMIMKKYFESKKKNKNRKA